MTLVPPRPRLPNIVPSIFHRLAFQIEPADGKAAYWVDLDAFVNGDWDTHFRADGRLARWDGSFEGRRGFAYALARALCEERPQKEIFESHAYALRTLFRFLDSFDLDQAIAGVDDLTDLHGIALRDWVDRVGIGRYDTVAALVAKLRRLAGRPPLLWPVVDRRLRSRERASPTVPGLKAFYRAVRKEAGQVKASLREGASLAAAGGEGFRCIDPDAALSWKRQRHAWIGKEMLKDETHLGALGRLRLHEAPHLPDHRPPGVPPSDPPNAGDLLRWVAPGFHDSALFLWLFLLKTGWNLGTALAVDVTHAEWAKQDAEKPGYVTIEAYKGRAQAFQTTTSRIRYEWDPYGLVLYMLEITEPLRAILRSRLRAAEQASRERSNARLDRQISAMKVALKSPWLYHRFVRGHIEVLAFVGHDCSALNNFARRIARTHGLFERHEELRNVVTSTTRQAWIDFAYERSGFDIIVAKLSGQHEDLATTQRYIRTRHLRTAARERFRAVQDAVFAELAAEKPLDPTRLRLLVERGEITEEQERRLRDLRARTRVGMGCKDPEHPPKKVAPTHRPGTLCTVQRCTGCEHGVAFEDSLPHLARRLVELRLIQESLPEVSWSGSSFEAEAISTDATLARFDPVKVLEAMNEWDDKFSGGEAHVPEIAACPECFEKEGPAAKDRLRQVP